MFLIKWVYSLLYGSDAADEMDSTEKPPVRKKKRSTTKRRKL